MKKLKFLLMSLVLLVFLGFSLFFLPVEVKATSGNIWLWTASEEARSFRDIDDKGVRVYIYSVYVDNQGYFDYAEVSVPKTYDFGGTSWNSGTLESIGSGFFDDSLADLLAYYMSQYGSGNIISAWDRSYLYFDVLYQKFFVEYHGDDYLGFWIGRYSSAYSEGYSDGVTSGEGYNEGYAEGYDVGHTEGYAEGYSEGFDVGKSVNYDEGYDVGYNYGYEVGYDEGYIEGIDLGYQEGYYEGYIDGLYISECGPIYEQGFKDGQESRLAENNAAFYQGIEKWLVPAIITVIALGGFVSIAVRKRRDE